MIRNHNGTVTALTKLSAKPAKPFTDGTYYVDTAAGDIYLYSQLFSTYAVAFAGNSVTLQINLNNGEAVLTRVVSTNSPVGDLPVPKRDGYTFGGWFTDSTLTTPYDPRMIASSDFAVYAKWTPKKRGGKTGGNGGGNTTGGGSGSEPVVVQTTQTSPQNLAAQAAPVSTLSPRTADDSFPQLILFAILSLVSGIGAVVCFFLLMRVRRR